MIIIKNVSFNINKSRYIQHIFVLKILWTIIRNVNSNNDKMQHVYKR